MNGPRAFFFVIAAIAVLGACQGAAADAGSGPGAPPVSAHLTATYNNNVSASSAPIAALRGLKQVDETYSPSLVLNYFNQMGFESFFLQGQGGYDFYQRNTTLNRERIQVSGGTQLQFDDCPITVSGTYARHQSDLEDLGLGPIKNTEEDVSGTLAASCNQSGTLVPSGSVSQSLSNNSELLRKISDNRSISANASLLYRRPDLGEISLVGQYVDAVYPNRILFGGGLQDGYKLYGGGLSIQHEFGSHIGFNATVSQTSLHTDGGLGVNFNGLSYDAAISYQPTPRLGVEFDFNRKPSPATSQLDATYTVADLYHVQGDYKLSARTDLKLGASQNQQIYYGYALVPGVDLTHEKIGSIFGTLSHTITPRASLDLTVTLNHRRADLSYFNYSGLLIGLSLSQAF